MYEMSKIDDSVQCVNLILCWFSSPNAAFFIQNLSRTFLRIVRLPINFVVQSCMSSPKGLEKNFDVICQNQIQVFANKRRLELRTSAWKIHFPDYFLQVIF